MEFGDFITTPKLDGVILHSPFNEPIDGTLCITGHHLIVSTRKENVQELWVSWVLLLIETHYSSTIFYLLLKYPIN